MTCCHTPQFKACKRYSLESNKAEDSGFALLMVIFIISLATILVTAFTADTFTFLKRNRAITSGLEAEYAAKSGVTLAVSTLEMPDDPSMPVRPWQILNSMPSLPIPGFLGEIRVQIFDEGGKINLNAIMGSQGGPGGGIGLPIGGDGTGTGQETTNVSDFWKFTLAELFTLLGHGTDISSGQDASFQNPDVLTLGGTVFPPQQQVAVLHDWIDRDMQPFSSPHFPAQGIEGPGMQHMFMNRPLQSLDELGRVPGFTNTFLQRLAPFVRVGMASDYKINVNTAPPLVLQVIGFTQDELLRVIQQRSIQWLTAEELQSMVQGSVNLSKVTTVSSSHFKIIVRAKSASVTKWLEADCVVQSGFGKKVATIRKMRFL
jgi:type II secretory pathway component PulK